MRIIGCPFVSNEGNRKTECWDGTAILNGCKKKDRLGCVAQNSARIRGSRKQWGLHMSGKQILSPLWKMKVGRIESRE
jgi:hypothetical protein